MSGTDTSLEKLLLTDRLRPTTQAGRSPALETLSDSARILTCTSLRRLQTKAQVFSLEQNAAVRTRLTHTLEVAVFGEILATLVTDQLRPELLPTEYRGAFVRTVYNACLLHDIGNPPFGHLGEYAIRTWCRSNFTPQYWTQPTWEALPSSAAVRLHEPSFLHFDGNPQGLRIVTRLQWLHDQYGLNLTLALIAATLKYLSADTIDSADPFRRKLGYFATERDTVAEVWTRLGLAIADDGQPSQRHPLAFLVEAADDIAYCVSDIEDALAKRMISQEFFFDRLKKLVPSEGGRDLATKLISSTGATVSAQSSRDAQFVEFRIVLNRQLITLAASLFVQRLQSIVDGSFRQRLLSGDDDLIAILDGLREFAAKYLYSSREALDIELSGFRVVQGILRELQPLLDLPVKKFRELSFGSERPPDALAWETRLRTLLSSRYYKAYEFAVQNDSLENEPLHRAHLLIDTVAGMTDSHALKVYHMLCAVSVGVIP